MSLCMLFAVLCQTFVPDSKRASASSRDPGREWLGHAALPSCLEEAKIGVSQTGLPPKV